MHTLPPATPELMALERRLQRERAARKEAEQLLTERSRALYDANQELEKLLLQAESTRKRLQLALWASGEAIWEWQAETDQLEAEYFDPRTQDVSSVRQSLLDAVAQIHAEDTPAVWIAWNAHLFGKTETLDVQFRVRVRGEWRWQRMRGRALSRSPEGIATRITGTRKDVSGLRAREESLRLLAAAFANTSDAMMVLSSDLTILQVNDALLALSGYNASDLRGAHPGKLLRRAGEDGDIDWSALLAESRWRGEWHCLHAQQHSIPVEISISTLRDDNDELSHVVVALHDISERHRAAERLAHMARQDALTHLPNRLHLQELLTQSLQRRQPDQVVDVLFIDLDGFKEINDSLGHDAGDALLIAVAERLQFCLRHADQLARWGGDEFVILLAAHYEPDAGENMAHHVLTALNLPFRVAGHEVTITPSIGISSAPDHGDDPYVLLRHADAAMYAAKRGGRNRYAMYAPNMTAHTLERVQRVNALRRAIDNGELSYVLQPKVRLRDRRIIGAEMLMRWQSESLGRVSPASFIPLAEEHGLIVPIGRWLMQQAADVLQHWAGMPVPGAAALSLAVNLSAHQLRDDRLLEPFLPAGPHCRQLELEVTESALLDDAELAAARLDALRCTGLSVALDDFGTGFSSLSYLKALPLDHVKIDRSFIVDVEGTRRGRALLASIISLCRSLGFLTTAEGVETAAQLAIVEELGVDQVQGYFFSPPLPLTAFDALVQDGLPPAAGVTT